MDHRARRRCVRVAGLANGRLYVGCSDGSTTALRTSDGSVMWTYASGTSVQSTAALAGGLLYFGNDNGIVYALTAATGALRWSTTTPTQFPVQQSVTVANGVVYTGDVTRTYALAATYGGLLTTLDARGPTTAGRPSSTGR